jgi:uncharacterized protein (TIGR00369 family)
VSDETHARTRTITWFDPAGSTATIRGMSGLQALQAIIRGELPPPPIAVLMNIAIIEAEEGRVVFAGQPAEYHYNPIGSIHGGFAATIFDSALGCAIHSTLPAGVGYTTLDLHVRFVRPLTHETGIVRCEARAINVGKTIGTADARLTDSEGKLYGHATTSCAIFR